MKILLLTYEYPPFHGGVATYLSNLMNAAPAGVEVVVDVPKAHEHWIMTAWRQYFKVRKIRPDLIAISHVLPAGYVAFKINFWFKTPYLVFTHGTDILTSRRSGWKRFWMRFILRHAKFVIANSRFTASLLREEGIVKVEIIQPAVSIPTSVTPLNNGVHGRPDNVDPDPVSRYGACFSHTNRRNDNCNGIISIGRLIPRKGFDTLIQAMPAIIKEIPDARLTIIGRGDYYDELIRLAHELRVETFVDILTDVDDKKKGEYLAMSALFALAARKVGDDIEGFGIVTLEASAAGLPVVVTNSGGSAEPVVDNVTGIIAPSNDPATLAAIIMRLLKNKDEAAKLGAAGQKHVAEEYSISVIAKRFWSTVIPNRSGGSQRL